MDRTQALDGFLDAVREGYADIESEAAARFREKLAALSGQPGSLVPATLPICSQLDSIYEAEADNAIVQAARALSPHLAWRFGERPGTPEYFKKLHAFVVIVGLDGLLPAEDCRLGLFLQAPDTYYPAHAHDAEELYLILSGQADWQAGEEKIQAKPGRFIHHPSTMVHVMETGPAPLLALWGWMGALDGGFWFPDDPRAKG